MPQTKKVVLGRVPNYRGDWVDNIPYYRQNMVSHLNGLFVSNVDNNKGNEPVSFERDEDGKVIAYTINMNWKCVANAFDAIIYANQQGDRAKEAADDLDNIIVTYDEYPIQDPDDDTVYTTSASQRMIADILRSRMVTSDAPQITLNDTSIFSTSGVDRWIGECFTRRTIDASHLSAAPDDGYIYSAKATYDLLSKTFRDRIITSTDALRADPNDTSIYSSKAVRDLIKNGIDGELSGSLIPSNKMSSNLGNDKQAFTAKASKSMFDYLHTRCVVPHDSQYTPNDTSVFSTRRADQNVKDNIEATLIKADDRKQSSDTSIYTSAATDQKIAEKIGQLIVSSQSGLRDEPNDTSVYTMKAVRDMLATANSDWIVRSTQLNTNNDSSAFSTKATKMLLDNLLIKSDMNIPQSINDSSVFTTKAILDYLTKVIFKDTPYAVVVS